MNKEKVLDLAKLARIEISEEEAENLSHEFDSILTYVGEIKTVAPTSLKAIQNKSITTFENIMRDDASPHESGLYTQKILEQAPTRDGGYIKVKKIL